MSNIFIKCGLEDEKNVDNKYIWPVLKLKPILFKFKNYQGKKFSIIFTSQFAVTCFQNTLQNNTILEIFNNIYLENICAVGASTAEFFQCVFKEYLTNIRSQKSVIFYETEGLKNVLIQTQFSNNSECYIFTSENGKSKSILTELKKNHFSNGINCQFNLIPVYTIESNNSLFLSKLFKNGISSDNYIFNCRSGKVLHEVILQLCNYFSCRDVQFLPSNFLFKIEKESTLLESRKYNLVDRKWT